MRSIPMQPSLPGDVVKDGVIALTDRGTMHVPHGPGLGVALDPDRLAAAAEASGVRATGASLPRTRPAAGAIPVKSML